MIRVIASKGFYRKRKTNETITQHYKIQQEIKLKAKKKN